MPGRGKSGPSPPGMIDRRRSSLHYYTFLLPPPKTRGHPLSREPSSGRVSFSHSNGEGGGDDGDETSGSHKTALPIKQLFMLAIIALAEQTALNSISPYLPEMTASFPGVGEGQTGVYVGIIASAFAVAQFTTNFFWASLSVGLCRSLERGSSESQQVS
jgi:hypothetical protein